MRAFVLAVAALAACACGQKADHPEYAPGCDTGRCFTPPTSSLGGGNESAGGAGSEGALGAVSGNVIAFADDFFDQGTVLTTAATVSAVGQGGGRVKANYDGASFELEGVLKTAANWFLVEPLGNGVLPTLTPVDTRSTTSDLLGVGVAQSLTVDGIFSLMGTERAAERAQVVLHVVDAQGASVAGVRTTFVTERVGYRAAGSWLVNDEGTDDSGLIFLGNVAVGSALTTATVALSGNATGRAQIAIQAGTVSVATVLVARK